MIDKQIEIYTLNNKREDIEHIGKYYPVYASCNLIINKSKGHTKVHGMCMRAAYYSCIGLSESTINTNRMIARKLGDYTEYMLLSVLDKNGSMVEKGVKFINETHNISGKLDAIIKVDDIESGVEIKSIGSNKWTVSEIFGSQWNKAKPKIEHLLQCIVYLNCFIGRLDKFYLVYIRRDTGEIKEFEISLALIDGILYPTVDGIILYELNSKNIFDRYIKLHEYLTNNQVPPRDYNFIYSQDYAKELYEDGFLSKFMYNKHLETPIGDFQCFGCGHRDICIKDK
jgi:hypothetical protein